MYVNMQDEDNFNHRHGSTLMFSETHKQWVFVDGIFEAGAVHFRLITDSSGRTTRDKLSKAKIRFLSKNPEIQFYNDFLRGEALFLRKKSRRQYRQTLSMESSDISYPFWSSLPLPFQRELGANLPNGAATITTFGWLLNNHRYKTFEETIRCLDDTEMASCAFSKNFMLSLNPTNRESYRLWYTHIPVGVVNKATRKVVVDKLFLLQEVKDCLRSQNCSWVVVE